MGVPESRLSLRHRLGHREASLLSVIKRGVYEGGRSPYRSPLRYAGCAYGDLEKLVAANGVESALRTLLHQGVYLTGEELKGRQPVVRGQTSSVVELSRLRNPAAAFHLPLRSSGSRGAGTLLGLDLAFIREASTNLVLDARGGGRWHHAIWGVPGSAEILRVLRYSAVGTPPVRWFSQIDSRARDLHPSYRWSARLLRGGSRLAGVRLPRPAHVPTER